MKLIWKYSYSYFLLQFSDPVSIISTQWAFVEDSQLWDFIILAEPASHGTMHSLYRCVTIANGFSDILKFLFWRKDHMVDILASLFEASGKNELCEKSLFLWPVCISVAPFASLCDSDTEW